MVCDVGVTKLRHFVRGACVNLVHFAGLLHCTGGGGGGEAQKSVIFVLICVMTKICLSMGLIVTFVGALDVVADVINNNFDSSIRHLLRLLLRAELFAIELFQLHLPNCNLRCCLVLGGASASHTHPFSFSISIFPTAANIWLRPR